MLLTLSVDVDHDEVDQLKQTHYAPYPSNYPCARIWTQNWHICANISPFRRNIANECSRACRMNTRTLPMSDVMWRRQNSITRLPIDSPHQGLQMVLFWWAVAAVMVHTQTTIYGAEAKVMFSFCNRVTAQPEPANDPTSTEKHASPHPRHPSAARRARFGIALLELNRLGGARGPRRR